MNKLPAILILAFLATACDWFSLCREPVPINFDVALIPDIHVNNPTKAPVTVPSEMGPIQICRKDGTVADYSSLNQPTLTGTVHTDGHVVPSTQQYYLSDGTLANFIAYHPQANSLNAGVANFRITGQEDIMVGVCWNAGNSQSPVTVSFTFSHLLSQINYQVIAESQASADAWGTITYIKTVSPTSLDLTLNNQTLTANAIPLDTALPSSIGSNATLALSTSLTSAGSVMVFPGSRQLILTIKTSKSDILTIPTSLWYMAPGNIHTVTLTFKGNATGIPITASLTGWPE
ncbi:MAG: fimbrillin family protein [Bacteroidales bacterium]|jgi:hypothetical protein|nr:fimbrillin family protein [Bacteroidales bacterium]